MPPRKSDANCLCLLRLGFVVVSCGTTGLAFGTDALKPHQAVSTNAPPASPQVFSPDPNRVQLPEPPPTNFRWTHRVIIVTNSLAQPQFNPDPGASFKKAPSSPPALFKEPTAPPEFTPPQIPPGMELPRENSRIGEILPPPGP